MAPIELYERIVMVLQKTLSELIQLDENNIIFWLDICSSAIAELKNFKDDDTLTRGEKQKFQTCMSHLSYMQVKFEQHVKRGEGLAEQELEGLDTRVEWRDVESAFKNRIKTGVIANIKHVDIMSFMKDASEVFKSKIKLFLDEFNAVKVNAEFIAEFIIEKSVEEKRDIKYFSTESEIIYKTTVLDAWFKQNIREPILKELEEFQERDSGWSLKSIISLCININKFSPIRANSYIALPVPVRNKKACINIRNKSDNACFKWSVLAALHPKKFNSFRVSKYRKYDDELSFAGIDFPVKLTQIRKFENLNDISVNVYILQKHGKKYEVSPCHVTSEKRVKHVNLLLIQDKYPDLNEENSYSKIETIPKYHYVLIKSLSRLLNTQISKRTIKSFYCERCLHAFYSQEKLLAHDLDCKRINKCRINLPREENKILKFKDHLRNEKVPFVIYADFECLLKNTGNEKAFQLHEAYSIGFYMKCSYDDSKSYYKSHRKFTSHEKSPAEWFVAELKTIADNIETIYKNPVPMRLTDSEELRFYRSLKCHICQRDFEKEDLKVRDHCHLTGRFRGAAHNKCNLNYKNSRYIPVIFHNLNYDSHFILKEIALSTLLKGDVTVIPENKEKYISFTKNINGCDINFRFIDSFRFLPSSLEKLASYLEKLPIAEKIFQKDGYSCTQIDLLKRKGIFPYDFVDNHEKLNSLQLPSREEFYNKLTDSHITTDDYSHAINVWNEFKIKSLGEYSDIYLKTDVLLLADVFENFRETCLEAYDLDPAHFYTTPGLTWSAMLKFTKVELELLTDIDMLLFVESGIRGGISQCCNRYAKANNRYMGSTFDEKQEVKTLLYYDINNLYGWAMEQYLPTGKFEWTTYEKNSNFYNAPENSKIGFIAEVDLEYPESIHDHHRDLPFCAEHRAPPDSKQQKLLTTLYNKERYVIHYRALKQALDNGLRLVKVHRILKFEQSAWLKPYVELNTAKRKQAKNEFDKLFYKLMVNSVYGKTMECERKRCDVKLISRWENRYGAEARIAQPNFHSCSIFDENLVAIQLKRTSMTIQKPIYIGLCVLDLSKTLVYDFHYSYMKKRIGEKCKLLYTDTDSLIYEIQDLDMYKIMKEDIHRFDTSDYDIDNKFKMPLVNKKVIGLMKDECNGKIIQEFIGLRSKMYSILIEGGETIKKAKGVKTGIVQKSITFDDYRRCLFDRSKLECEQCNIRSRLHIVHTEKQKKIALSPYDDKRYILPNCDTLPWGHHRIMEKEMAAAKMGLKGVKMAAPTIIVVGAKMAAPTIIEEDAKTAAPALNERGPPMTAVSEKRLEGDFLESAIVGGRVKVGNRLYLPRNPDEEHIRLEELENLQPCKKKRRLSI